MLVRAGNIKRFLYRVSLGLGLVLTVPGCMAHARGEVVYDYPVVYAEAPPRIESYPSTYYHGRPAYLVDGRWYYRTNRNWVVFREEPVELRSYRVRRAPAGQRYADERPYRLQGHSEARRYDDRRAAERRAESRRMEERRAAERRAESRRVEERRAAERRAESRRMEERRAAERRPAGRSDDRRVERRRSDDHPAPDARKSRRDRRERARDDRQKD
jgi:hypothetical protein